MNKFSLVTGLNCPEVLINTHLHLESVMITIYYTLLDMIMTMTHIIRKRCVY